MTNERDVTSRDDSDRTNLMARAPTPQTVAKPAAETGAATAASAAAVKRRVQLGDIGSAHGIRGEVVVRSFTADPFDIAAYGVLEDAKGRPVPKLTVVRDSGRGLVCRLDGVKDRTAAEGFRGTQLWVARERLPPPEPGAYYHVDLIGLAAVSPAGDPVGRIVDVANFGAGDLIEVRLEGGMRTEYVPFTDAFVPSVDIAAGTATVVMPTADADGDGDEPGDDEDADDGGDDLKGGKHDGPI